MLNESYHPGLSAKIIASNEYIVDKNVYAYNGNAYNIKNKMFILSVSRLWLHRQCQIIASFR